jgi:hypothetical protein
MTTTRSPWTNPIRLPDGHRIFQATEPFEHAGLHAISVGLLLASRGMWAVADNSGPYPDDTDDGLLWLDFSRDLNAGMPVTEQSEAITPTIPLLDTMGEGCSTITDTCTLLWLSVRFGWSIYAMGKTVEVRER